MQEFILLFLGCLAVVAVPAFFYLVWRHYLSIKVVPQHYVGVRRRFGAPEDAPKTPDGKPYPPGKVFVPWIPIKFDGFYPYDLVLVPTDRFNITYKAEPGDKIYSKGKKTLLFPEVTLYITFPWAEYGSILKMLKANVPLDLASFTAWAEDAVMAVLKRVLRTIEYEEVISGDLTAMGKAFTSILCEKDSVLESTGVTGEVPSDITTPGAGCVSLSVEGIGVPQPLEDALAAPEIAKQQALAAKSTARQEATEVSDPIVLMVDEQIEAMRKHAPDLTKQDCLGIRRESLDFLRRRRTMKDGGKWVEARIANSDGSPLAQGSLSEIVGGIVAAAMVAYAAKDGGGQGKDPGNRDKSDKDKDPKARKNVADMTVEEMQRDAESW